MPSIYCMLRHLKYVKVHIHDNTCYVQNMCHTANQGCSIIFCLGHFRCLTGLHSTKTTSKVMAACFMFPLLHQSNITLMETMVSRSIRGRKYHINYNDFQSHPLWNGMISKFLSEKSTAAEQQPWMKLIIMIRLELKRYFFLSRNLMQV